MSKENKDKDMLVRVQPTLFEKFKEKCEANYKSISEVIRDFMQQYIKEDKWNIYILTSSVWNQQHNKKSCLTSTSVV